MSDPTTTQPSPDEDPEHSPVTGQPEMGLKSTRAPRLSVVGIGASAGGLAALRAFFSATPNDTGMTFVVVTHLSPEHESILPALLQSHTGMPVTQVTEKVEMQPNHVYVIPPARRLLVHERDLELAELAMPRGQRLQIDVFLRSLAEHHGDGAAVILSGAGSDGAVGIQSIKEGGGLILAQDPDEAEYSGMPKSAIATGLVDIVAPAAELARQLVTAKRTVAALDLPADPEDLSTAAEETLMQILTHLHVRTGHDFSGYKRSTILRRIGRRMGLAQIQNLTAYLHRLRQDGHEANALFRDLLIHVTEFFRDPEAWEALAERVIPQLFAGKGRDDHIRAWVVGCATGEEAYGLAMLLQEHAATVPDPPQIQIFASDLGDLALDFARRGVYPQAIAANVSLELLERYFVEDNSHYRVQDDLRQTVLFTSHNLLQDPPFSKVDLILCRNLLIYLQREVQERVFESFHYALRQDSLRPGYLFLGSAESTDSVTDLFETVDKQQRIFRRSRERQGTPVLPSLPLPTQSERRRAARETRREQRPRRDNGEHGRLVEALAPPSLLVDAQYRLRRVSETAGRFLLLPSGALTDEVLKLVRPELQNELQAALFRALEVGKATLTRPMPVHFNGAPHPVALLVRPSSDGTEPNQAIVFFLEDETPLQDDADADAELPASVQQMRAELGQAQQQLQRLREDFETTVEELRAANEELQSTNEEYRSTLEELETSKEELQSMNEELHTVNQEMKHKMDTSAQAHNDLQNLFVATEIATLFLDRELRVKRYTPRAAELFNLMPPDLDRPIGHLRSNVKYAELEADARRVLKSLTPVMREVKQETPTDAGRWFQVNVRPYRTHNDHIDGVVITFVDITTNKANELALGKSEERYRLLMENVREYAIFMLDPDNRITNWNTGAQRIFGYTEAEAIGQSGSMIFIEEDREAGAPEQEIATARQEGQAADDRWHVRKDGSRFWANGVMTALYHPDGDLRGFAKVLRDNTERKEAEDRLKALNETLEARVRERTQQVRDLVTRLTLSEQAERRRISQILHDDLQQRLYSIQFHLASLRSLLDPEKSEEALAIQGAIDETLQAAVAITRSLSVDLSPPVLHGEGLAEAVRWLANQMERQHGLTVEVQATDDVPVPGDDLRVLLFQTVRELLFNVVKHAGVSTAVVRLDRIDNHIHVEVIDQGDGFDVDAAGFETSRGDEPERHGLFQNRQRLDLIGGRLQVESKPGAGTRVVIECPLSA